jgi:tetratricopeptide (TPR) repeat protein
MLKQLSLLIEIMLYPDYKEGNMLKRKNNTLYRIRTHVFLGLFIMLLNCPVLNAANPDTANTDTDRICKTLRSMGRLLLTLEEPRKAKDIFEKALLIARQKKSSQFEQSQCLMDLGWACIDLNQLTEAESLYEEAGILREKMAGKEHPDMIDIWRNQAEIHRLLGKYNLAETELKKAIDIFSLYHQNNEPSYGPLWIDMGQLLTEMGKPAEAEPYYLQAENMVAITYGTEHLYTANLYSKMAYFYCVRGNYALSENYLKRAEIIYMKHSITNPSLLIPDLLTKARLYALKFDYIQSLQSAQSALAMAEKSVGSRTPLAADCLSTIAEIYYSKGNFIDAEEQAKKAGERFEISLGKTSTKTLQTNYLVLKTLFHLNRTQDAEALRRELITRIKNSSQAQELLINQLYDNIINMNS